MYKQYFGLKESPFNVTPDPRFLYSTPHTEEAMACLTYCVQARKGFVMLTGDVGTGKTTLLNKLLEWLRQEQIASAFVFNPRLNPFQFLDYAMSDFGVNCQSRLKSAILSELNSWLLARFQAGTTAVLIVDEAQDCTPELLEEIRLLTNLETPSGKLLQIVLSGQQELEMKLRLPEFRQLRQRIMLRAKTHPLTLEETHEYIATRLRVAGSDGRPTFSTEAIDAVRKYSEGIPRIINILCEDSLVSAFADQQTVVPRSIVEDVARELELDLYPATAPPPPETRLDDLVHAGVYVNRGNPSAPRPEPVPVEPLVEDEAPPVRPSRFVPASMSPPAAQTAPPQPMIRKSPPAVPAPVEPPAPATVRTAVWAPSGEAPKAKAPYAFSDDPRWGEPPAVTEPQLPPGIVVPPRSESPASDDEILQTLRGKEASKAPSPAPVAKPPAPAPAPRPSVPPPPFVMVTKAPPQSRALWLAIVAALIAGAAGAYLIWNHTGLVVPAANVTAPSPAPAPAAAGPESAAAQAPAIENPATSPPPAPAPAEGPTAVAPGPQPEAKPEPEAPPPPRAAKPAPRESSSPSEPPARQRPATSSRSTSSEPAQPVEDPQAVPASIGKGVITSSVEGAKIYVDGKTSRDWVTPYVFSNLEAGAHSIIISKPGFQDVATRMTIREGQTSYFRANLAASSGEISIITEPPGLSVSFDGGPFQTSPVQITLAAGPHKYRIRLPNSRIYEGSVDMKAGSIITRRVDFTGGEWLGPAQ